MNPKHIRTVQQIDGARSTCHIELTNQSGSEVAIRTTGRMLEIYRRNANPGSYMMIEVDNEPPEVARPGEDAGAALVGVRCYVWDRNNEGRRYGYNFMRNVIAYEDGVYWAWSDDVRGNGTTPWDHARPTYLGHPDPAIRAREVGR